jgi:hypothetical protein
LEPVFGRALYDLVGSNDWYGIMPFRLGYPTRSALASPRRSVQESLALNDFVEAPACSAQIQDKAEFGRVRN